VWQDHCMMHEMIYKALGLRDWFIIRRNDRNENGSRNFAGNLLSYQSLNRIDKTKSSPIENYTVHIKGKQRIIMV
jgi:hypothetical protein